ncbi:hypothetical protein PI124_g18470 [Phytophthora idaei]|nr:hypothetical protein PI125_g19623 [Phytophthora idaei]KAG3138769.1 hypothetical protein PI126_g16762 [Phytophthora idaei]KAG3236521.1 hypothetical protein PI124_g18470 [Phytophthora idaei]
MVRNVVQQALNSANGNSGGHSTGATPTTGAPLTSSTTTAPVSVPCVAVAGMPTTHNVVAALGRPIVPGTTASGVPVVQSLATTGLLTAPTSSTVGPVSVPVANGQSAPNVVQLLQGGAGQGVGTVLPPTWVPSGPAPGRPLASTLPSGGNPPMTSQQRPSLPFPLGGSILKSVLLGGVQQQGGPTGSAALPV